MANKCSRKVFYQILDGKKVMATRTTEKAILKDAMDFKRKGRKFTRVIRSNKVC